MGMSLRAPTFTVLNLRDFPEDGQRYELLDGTLLVTPAPGSAHQVVLGRLQGELYAALRPGGAAWVVSPGEIEASPRTLLQPDLLVVPSRYAPGTPWREMADWWLAVEVLSPSSRVYDRDFKRDAYLTLGVAEVWLVDLDARAIFVSRPDEPRDVRHERDLAWHAPGAAQALHLEIPALFRDVP